MKCKARQNIKLGKFIKANMNVLGIYDGHNSNAALIVNGKIIKVVEEERFSRKKNHDARISSNSGPIESVRYCIGEHKIDIIALALEEPKTLSYKSSNSFFKDIQSNIKRKERIKFFSGSNSSFNQKFTDIQSGVFYEFSSITQKKRIEKIKLMLLELNLKDIPIIFVNHHLAHHASSYFSSKKNIGLSFSLDGKGDNLSGMVCDCNDGNIEIIHEQNYINSIGHFYSAITVALGFKAVRHEGKITGLAAYGKINKNLIIPFRGLFKVNKQGEIISRMADGLEIGPYPHTNFKGYLDKIKNICKGYSKEDVAATAQFLLEEIVCEWVRYWLRKNNSENIFLSGGVFSNVKLNQKIYEIDEVKHIYIHPGMSDSGLGVGSALYAYNEHRKSLELEYKIHNYNNVFFGPSFNNEDILKDLKKSNISYYLSENLEYEVAQFLSRGKVVARFLGAMEYGPRSLGHRSVLCAANDKSVNNWLNKRFNRTEFMPFAPATLSELADQYYLNKTGNDYYYASKFMTITCSCTDLMKKHSPAVVHIDGTARPQLVSKEDDQSYYQIIKYYHDITGIGNIINTSFNMHEEPIVCSPEEAIDSFIKSELDILAIGDYIAVLDS